MAAANMNGPKDVYGYDVISKVKGSISIRLNINMFKVSANKLLTSETRAAYNAAFDDISKFVLKTAGFESLVIMVARKTTYYLSWVQVRKRPTVKSGRCDPLRVEK